jgi:hypothetical protein
MTEPRDRVLAVTASGSYNGIDFVEVAPPRTLVVHFLNQVAVADPSITAAVTGGDSVPTVALQPITASDWSTDAEGRPLLTLTALADGDFSNYTLAITAPKLDLILDSTVFSFKAGCPSEFDCAPTPAACPPSQVTVPPIDYLSRDFQSFQQALLAFSSLRYPNWVERSEADFGMMMAELLSALGDELSYLQDRVAAEATLPNATQRRSLVSLARLVDYEPQPATSATTVLQCNVSEQGRWRPGRSFRRWRRTVRQYHSRSVTGSPRLPTIQSRTCGTTASRPIGSTTASSAGRPERPICGCRITASTSQRARRC